MHKKSPFKNRLLTVGVGLWFLSLFLPIFDTTGTNLLERYEYGFNLLRDGVFSIPFAVLTYQETDSWLMLSSWLSSVALIFVFKKSIRLWGAFLAFSSIFIERTPLGGGASYVEVKYCLGYFVWLTAWALIALSGFSVFHPPEKITPPARKD